MLEPLAKIPILLSFRQNYNEQELQKPRNKQRSSQMPKISDIEDKGKKGLDISNLPWLKKAIGSDLSKGGIR